MKFLAWSAEHARGGAPNWRSLGTAPRGKLAAEWIEDAVVLAVLGEDENVHAAAWHDYPEPPAKLEWQSLGTMNDLISARYSLVKRD